MALRVLCVSPGYYPAFELGGVASSVHSLNRALVALGHEVTVCATIKFLRGKVVCNKPVDVDHVTVYYFDFSLLWEKMGLRQWMVSLALLRFLKNETNRFDIVHIHTIWDPPASIAAHYCRKYGKQYLMSTRGMLLSPAVAKNSMLKRLYFSCFAKKDLNHASCIHFTSRREAEQSIAGWGLNNEYSIVYNSVSPSEHNDESHRLFSRNEFPEVFGKRIILFLGRIDAIKGIDLLVEAFAQVKRQFQEVHLVIAGNDEVAYADFIKKYICNLGLQYRDRRMPATRTASLGARHCDVTFTGQISGARKSAALSESTALALPSYSENFGMVAAEAMIAGIPVIVSNTVGIAPEINEWEAGIIVSTDAKAVAKAIATILSDPQLAQTMGKRGRDAAIRYFSAEAVGKQMASLYEKIEGGK